MEAILLHNQIVFNQPNYRISKNLSPRSIVISSYVIKFTQCHCTISLIKKNSLPTFIWTFQQTHIYTHENIISKHYIKVLLTEITKQNRKTATQNYHSLFGIVMPLLKLTKTKNCWSDWRKSKMKKKYNF